MRATKENILHFLSDIKSDLQKDGITTLGLFGSFAKGEQTVYSDIDIAIAKEKDYLKTRSSYHYFSEIEKIKALILKKFQRNSDVFDLDSDSVMKTSITKELLYV